MTASRDDAAVSRVRYRYRVMLGDGSDPHEWAYAWRTELNRGGFRAVDFLIAWLLPPAMVTITEAGHAKLAESRGVVDDAIKELWAVHITDEQAAVVLEAMDAVLHGSLDCLP